MSSIWSRLINLAGNVTGILGVPNGGTGLASGTSGGVLGFTGTTTLASSALLGANGVVIGGGAAATPTAITAGTNGQLLVGVTSGAPAFGSTVSAATTFSGGVLYSTSGGTPTNLNYYEEFNQSTTFQGSGGGAVSSASAIEITRIGRHVSMTVPAIGSTASPQSASTHLECNTNIPARFFPPASINTVILYYNNGSLSTTYGFAQLTTGGEIDIYRDPATTAFTSGSNVAGFLGFTMSWDI